MSNLNVSIIGPDRPKIVIKTIAPHVKRFSVNFQLLRKDFGETPEPISSDDVWSKGDPDPIHISNLDWMLKIIPGVEQVSFGISAIEVSKGEAYEWVHIIPSCLETVVEVLFKISLKKVKLVYSMLPHWEQECIRKCVELSKLSK